MQHEQQEAFGVSRHICCINIINKIAVQLWKSCTLLHSRRISAKMIWPKLFLLLSQLDHGWSYDWTSTSSEPEWPAGDTRGCLSHRGRNSAGYGSAPDWISSNWALLLATAPTLSGQQGTTPHTWTVSFIYNNTNNLISLSFWSEKTLAVALDYVYVSLKTCMKKKLHSALYTNWSFYIVKHNLLKYTGS